ncbi:MULTISPECIES: substrate-binding periplasmic protein [Pseudoalteromonas]|uniref:ABC transporter n=1 Tax=Pseudoalteromonas fuliginea TaxID=1872678 RepID=A0ABD3Y652_9GAMM|nr:MULTISPECIES: ABC transporter substrate-binding protein [Pseudoalteromonas]ALQ06979.1 ABC transporter [Pseudoalteromonas sp. Bsw20308]KAA1150224.1 transporter substrate-binding domain-containing protein [Pseudoalteromonas fuliginea]KAA1164962.1 transporter substrate-binding domain-containing protein [Pseudoalteromonas fuliginea]KDC49666.1 ABC transporter [Pseudoalteromonas fuliginea]KDC54884.1 ABC transporter [Pseudoalteromonas sp. S3431]
MKTTLFFLLLTFSNFIAAETVYLTSLAWPPYSDKSLEQQGASVAVAKAAFKAEGHELIVDFYPWSRAVNSASQANSKYVGYFPEYMHETSDFVFSDATGTGPLGLLQNNAKPIAYSSVGDLKGKRIGVVQDYVNTKELDDMIASGTIKGDAAPSDVLNIKKVAAGRIDAAVIDANVLKYLLDTDKSLSALKNKVAMNTTLLEDKKLYIAFRNDTEGQKWQKIYNQGLTKIDVNTIMANYLK